DVLLAQLRSEPTDVYVDGASAAVVLVAPHARQQDLAREDLARVLGQEFEQFVLHVGEVEGTAADVGLVRLQVQRQRPVLDELGAGPAALLPEQVLEPGLELTRVERREAEVVEEVVAQLEIGELGP